MHFRPAIIRLLLCLLLAEVAQAAVPEDPTSDYRLANQALQTLLDSPLGRTLPQRAWKIQVLQSWDVNAYSSGDGVISLTRGLGWVLDDHEGLWAAAIAHELAHSIMLSPDRQPAFEAEARREYAAGTNPDDPKSAEDVGVRATHGGMLHLGGQRQVEYEADRLGMLLMASAGYHPDFAIALDRRMLSTIGEQTRSSEFLLSHPIWSNRQQQNERDETVPLAIFKQRWPDASRSPGGPPPPFGKVQSVTVADDPKAGMLVLDVKFEMRNVAGRQARLAAILLDHNRKVRTSRAEYQAPDGSLAVNTTLPGFDHGPGEATVRIPADALKSGDSKLFAAIFLVAGDWTVDLWFQPLASAVTPIK